MVVDNDGEVLRPTFIIDANQEEVILYYEGLTSSRTGLQGRSTFPFSATGGNVKVGKIRYGDTLPPLNVYMEDGVCFLEHEKVTVIDDTLAHYPYQTNDGFRFSCEQGFNDSINGAYSPLADGFFFGIMTYDLFKE